MHPVAPHVVTTYASVFPSPEMDGDFTVPELVTCTRSRSVAETTVVPAPRRMRQMPKPATATTATSAAIAMNAVRGCTRRLVLRRAEAAVSSARTKSPAVEKRSAGVLARAFSTARSIASGTVSRTTRKRVGRSVRSLAIMACAVAPVTGGSPAIIS